MHSSQRLPEFLSLGPLDSLKSHHGRIFTRPEISKSWKINKSQRNEISGSPRKSGDVAVWRGGIIGSRGGWYVVRAVCRMAGSILSGSQDVTRGRVQTLDWRPREAEKDLSGEAPERLGGQERWGQKRNRFSASSGCTNVHQTLFSEADSRGPPRKLTLHGFLYRCSRHPWWRSYQEEPLSVRSGLKWEKEISQLRGPFFS